MTPQNLSWIEIEVRVKVRYYLIFPCVENPPKQPVIKSLDTEDPISHITLWTLMSRKQPKIIEQIGDMQSQIGQASLIQTPQGLF